MIQGDFGAGAPPFNPKQELGMEKQANQDSQNCRLTGFFSIEILLIMKIISNPGQPLNYF
ncbi:hypothetical protein A8B79_08890 [Balneola sp. EhC07]|nr:hypothetical protein A8B79_08890 [Balneola sp. EhC07]